MARRIILIALCVAIVHSAKFPFGPGQTQFHHVPEYHGQVTTYQGQQEHHHVPTQVNVPVHQGQVPVNQGHHQPTQVVGIIHQDAQVNPDGSFHNVWESENGIKVQEEGSVKVFAKDSVAQTVTGTVSYTDNEGTPFVLSYTADENGFHPQGEHLPVAPPLPPAIARALEYIATHPYVEDESVHGPTVEVN